MNNSVRIRTNVGEENKFLNFELKQDFDFIEILSLKLRQEDLYRLFSSDYGVVVGRVIVNSGVGVPNAKVSIFIPIDEDDKENLLISGLYPYENINDKDLKGTRYNLLPKDSQFDCHTPVGNLSNKREILDNGVMLEIYEKYYKFTTRTNDAGDFMLFGVPTGVWKLNVDVDLSDIGIISQKPYDFIRQGVNEKRFEDNNKFKGSSNLNDLVQIYNTETTVNVLPFWGDEENFDVGINRIDIELSYRIEPQAFFIGSIFGDNEKNSVNKRCGVRKDLGELCQTITTEGTIEMIRYNKNGEIESFLIEGGRVIDENGAWAYQIPMNLDYKITDEYGHLVDTEDMSKGIPTRAKVRFRIGMDVGDGEGRLRRRAKFLVPNSDNSGNYDFNEETLDEHFRDLYWNKIYSVKQFIPRFQPVCNFINCRKSRRFIGIKDVDSCGSHTPFPYNRIDIDNNILFMFMSWLVLRLVTLVQFLNRFILSPLNFILITIKNFQWSLSKIGCWAKHIGNKQRRGACRCYKAVELFGNDDNELPDYIDCNDSNWCADATYCAECYDNDDDTDAGDAIDNCNDDDYPGYSNTICKDRCKHLVDTISPPIGYIDLKCGEKFYLPWYYNEDGNASCSGLPIANGAQGFCTNFDGGIESTFVSDYIQCQNMKFAESFNLVTFDFYNDWVNGSLYAFLFKHKIKKVGKGKNKFCDWNCDEFSPFTDNDDDGNADNNCKKNHIVDICIDDYSASDIMDRELNEGVIKLYKDNYYYAATTHNGYPMFKTDLILLGNINNYDVYGIPLIYNQLENTSYKIPPIIKEFQVDDDGQNTNTIETSGISDLFIRFVAGGVFGLTVDREHCYNLRKICEIGVGLDEYRENSFGNVTVADKTIGSYDIENILLRNTLAILNGDNNNNINNIAESYVNNLVSYNTNFGLDNGQYTSPIVLNGNGLQYYQYRGFGNVPNIFPIKNSYFFYFGIHPGETGLDKFYSEFIQPCEVKKTNALILLTETISVTTFYGNDGEITITVLNGIPPFDYVFIYPDGIVEEYYNEESPFTFTSLSTGTYVIKVKDGTGLEGTTPVFVNGIQSISFNLGKQDVSSNGGNDGKLICSAPNGGVPDYIVSIISSSEMGVGTHYELSENTGSVEFTGLIAGHYTVEMTDSSSPELSYINEVTINEPEGLSFNTIIIEEITCNGGNGVFVLEIIGGVPPYNYSTEGLTNGVIYDTLAINGPAQEYKITVEDANEETVIEIMEFTEIPLMEISANYNSPTCYYSSDSYIDININGGTPPYTCSWYINGQFYTSSMTSYGINSLSPQPNGTEYMAVVEDAEGCTISSSWDLYQPPELIITTAMGPNPNSIKLIAEGGTGNYTFYLSFQGNDLYGPDSVSDNYIIYNNVSPTASNHYGRVIDGNGCEAIVGI